MRYYDTISQMYKNHDEGPRKMDKEPKFKVGDYVKVTTPTVASVRAGSVGVVTEVKGRGMEGVFDVDFGGFSQFCYEDVDGMVLVVKGVKDGVNSPSHYGNGSIECIEYIKDFLNDDEYQGYLRGNIAKYLHRWPYKNGPEDLKKAQVYLNWLIEHIEET